MKKTAVVRFIGNQEYYRLSCCESSYKYCRDCTKDKCTHPTSFQFIYGKLYNAYFLEYWQGERTSLHVKGEDERIDDFNPLEDFEIITDIDRVLNTHEARVRCITHDYDDEVFDLNFGNEYRAIGFDKSGMYLVMDECHDCYFYPCEAFEIIEDEHGILDKSTSSHIYDWENTHEDSIKGGE